MKYTPQSSLLTLGLIGQARWSDALAARIPRAEAEEISYYYHLFCPGHGLNADLALAQFCEETGYGTSDRWRRQRNACGLGITSDDVPGHDFGKVSVGIAAHLHHLCCYAYTAEACPVNHQYTPDFRHTFHDGKPALSHLQDDTRQWATKPGYVDRILAIANRILAASAPPHDEKGPNMGLTIREAIIPATNANRPKLPMVPRYITVHETANLAVGANAEMHRRFLVNGGGPDGVSFHWCVDDREAIHLIPDNEAAWHAGDGYDGPGNRQSLAIETCVNRDGDWAATRRNLTLLVATLMQRHGIPLANVVQHNRWSGKHCPAIMRRDGLWAGQLAAIDVAYRALVTPPPPPPRPPGWLNPEDEDRFKWEGAGIIVERWSRWYNPEERAFYHRRWSADRGYEDWVKEAS